MDVSSFPSAATLRADALSEFRKEVESLAKPIDWELVAYRRARCERFHHHLGRPQIQYKKQSGDRGRHFIVVRISTMNDLRAMLSALLRSVVATIQGTYRVAAVSLSSFPRVLSGTSCCICATSKLLRRQRSRRSWPIAYAPSVHVLELSSEVQCPMLTGRPTRRLCLLHLGAQDCSPLTRVRPAWRSWIRPLSAASVFTYFARCVQFRLCFYPFETNAYLFSGFRL